MPSALGGLVARLAEAGAAPGRRQPVVETSTGADVAAASMPRFAVQFGAITHTDFKAREARSHTEIRTVSNLDSFRTIAHSQWTHGTAKPVSSARRFSFPPCCAQRVLEHARAQLWEGNDHPQAD